MAGQPGQPQYGSGWPDGLLAGLGQPGHREARPLIRAVIGLIVLVYLKKIKFSVHHCLKMIPKLNRIHT